jgi:tRNA(Ile)-lysidine synthase
MRMLMDETNNSAVACRLAADWPPGEWRDTHVVLAVSGGADSVALLRGMNAIKVGCGGAGKLHVSHLNHGLRGAEADEDAAWLANLCERLGVPFITAKADVTLLAAEQGDGWEAAARTARYDFLRQTAERLGARFVATAHTADDQVETVLQRIVRGTGLAGLAGIPRSRPLSNSVALVRPMLTLRRSDVIEYLKELGQEFRVDASNQDARFTRNRLRHELLPLIRERFSDDVDGALSRLATQAAEAQGVIEALAADIAAECVTVEHVGDRESRLALRVRIECSRLAGTPAIVVREVCKAAWRDANWPLQAMGFDEWRLLASMAGDCREQSVVNLPGNIRAHREGKLLVCESPGPA